MKLAIILKTSFFWEVTMNIKPLISFCIFGIILTLFTVYFLSFDASPILIQNEPIALDTTRTSTTPLEALLNNERPAIANATSQLQLLNDERLTVETELKTLQTQYNELKRQHEILIEEMAPYLHALSNQILNPLKKIKNQIEKQQTKHSDDPILASSVTALSYATDSIEQYMSNPSENSYEASLETAFKLIDDELAKHDVDSVFDVVSELMQSGYSATMLRMKLQKSKHLLNTFESNYVTVDNDETKQFKKTKQQQLATADALDLTALQLDEVALRLSGILDEIEQVTQ